MKMTFDKLGLPTRDGKIFIAGPCSAETETQVMTTARELKDVGINIFRAGVWKPRTKPGCFEGYGEKALPWLERVKNELGMMTAIEVATPEHVSLAKMYGIDILWIGARTASNPFDMQALAVSLEGFDGVVLLKNPVNPDIELWIGGIQRLWNSGLRKIGLIHRGFSTFDKTTYRNPPIWQIPIELHRRIPEIPIICDPSHMGGRRDLILPLSQYALDLGYDGLMIESHCNPGEAWSDASQQVTPFVLSDILNQLVVKDKTKTSSELWMFRSEIDDIDEQLMNMLRKRFDICKKIGLYKKEHGMTVLQNDRYNEVLQNAANRAVKYGMNGEFGSKLFEVIHEESVNEQLNL